MDELKLSEKIQIVEDNIKKIENKDFNVFFYVLDTLGNASGSIEYLYQTALTLQKLGYKVTMLHQEKDFVGVEEWLGSAYSELPHRNIETENVEISPSDFLFIPEIFANVMSHTKNLPCKRVMIVQNYKYLSEFMPVASTPELLRFNEFITTTEVQKEKIREYFPHTEVHVVEPSISRKFRPSDEPQKMTVNIIAREQADINRVMKPFYWKHPLYKWVSFRDLRGVSQEVFSEALRDGAITIWLDETTNFGYSALEAMRCGTILLAKIPETLSDWNVEIGKDGNEMLTDACIWFDHLDDVPDMLASVVNSWINDNVPEVVYQNQMKLNDRYTPEIQEKMIKHVYCDEIFAKRKSDFEEVLAQLKNNKKK